MTHTPTPWPVKGELREFTDDEYRASACVNFFHGRDIATENIPESGFWELADMLKRVTSDFNMARLVMDADSRSLAGEIVGESRALLTRLGIEP